MPRAFVDGDHVRIIGVRDFDYRSTNDFAVRYREREVSISQLAGVDFLLSYWAVGPVAHTFLSFDFEDAPPICISIETRPEVGGVFAQRFPVQTIRIDLRRGTSAISCACGPIFGTKKCTCTTSACHPKTRASFS